MTNVEDFSRVFEALAIQLRLPDHDLNTIASYHEALGDLTLEALHEAAKVFAREHGRKFFPTTGEWRERAFLAFKRDVKLALESMRSEPWHHDCTACYDTGWEEFACPARPCDRTHTHDPHTYVRECPCRPTNRTYQRHYGVAAA